MAELFFHKAMDMRLLDYFAVHAPAPSKEDMNRERMKDQNKAHADDRYIMRDDMQIECELRYIWARYMMKVRQ